MSLLLLPGADWKPISYREEAGKFDIPPLGWIEHSAEGNGPLFDYFNRLKSPGRKFSTGWIGKDGSSQQYQEIYMKSWANSKFGNGLYWSFEFEGYAKEPLTEAQILVAARWHNFLNTVDYLADTTGQKGIGIHSMIVATSCPGNVRANQRIEIIRIAKSLRQPASPVVKPPVTSKPVVKPTTAIYKPPFALGAFPLPSKHAFGPRSGPVWQHSGYASGYDKAGLYVWQRAMKQRGWKITVDGYYGDQTESIAKQFQKEKRLTVDGLIGIGTWNRTKVLP